MKGPGPSWSTPSPGLLYKEALLLPTVFSKSLGHTLGYKWGLDTVRSLFPICSTSTSNLLSELIFMQSHRARHRQ